MLLAVITAGEGAVQLQGSELARKDIHGIPSHFLLFHCFNCVNIDGFRSFSLWDFRPLE